MYGSKTYFQNTDQIKDGSALKTFLDILISAKEQSGTEVTAVSILDKSGKIKSC